MAESAIQRAVFEHRFTAGGRHENPYVEVTATATLHGPDGSARIQPLFWDGGDQWVLRFAARAVGKWRWRVSSNDAGLDGRSGEFEAAPGDRPGSIRPMVGYPHHFQREDGSPFWFAGDTAWSLLHDIPENDHNRAAAEHYLDVRARQGFNVVHCMVISEVGDGNCNGMPFDDLAGERLNAAYWREVDHRVAYANARGLVVGLVLAWGQKKGHNEPACNRRWAWNQFPSDEARLRYARYIAARYGAFDVYFIAAGEWTAELGRRGEMNEAAVRQRFIDIAAALKQADGHGRMIGMHPMARHGSVREFAAHDWMSFGDYQQNYHRLHERVALSRQTGKPVVNSEYAYYLRDQDGDGQNDKENSFTPEDVRHSSWDICMAGGYCVTGFGTTYFGGHRNPGPFGVDADRNRPVEQQFAHLRELFTSLAWWRLIPMSMLLSCAEPRGEDREVALAARPEKKVVCPPARTYWALGEPGQIYLLYARGVSGEVELSLDATGGRYRATRFDPRTGRRHDEAEHVLEHTFVWRPRNQQDWVLLLERCDGQAATQP
jgi:hypothetical protein